MRKKVLFILVLLLMAVTGTWATDYNVPMTVSSPSLSSEQTAVVSIEQKDGKYNFMLKNFVLSTDDGQIGIGNVMLTGIAPLQTGNATLLLAKQTVTITDGDDASISFWKGTTMEPVDMELRGKIEGDRVCCYLTMDMSAAGLGLFTITIGEGYQMPNASFEAWHTSTGTYVEPNAWHSAESATGSLAQMAGHHVEKSADAHSGEASARIYASETMMITQVGTMTTGRMNYGSMSASNTSNHSFLDMSKADKDGNGDPFYTPMNARPDSVSVWLKFKQATPTAAFPYATVRATITDGTQYQDPENKTYTNVVAKAWNNEIATTGGEWKRIVIPFTYTENAVDPKAVLMVISTNATPGKGKRNDEVLVDDIEFIYNASLTSLTVKGEPVADFKKDVLSYEIEVDGNVTPDDIVAEADGQCTHIVKSVEAVDGGGYNCAITVVSGDMKTIKTYSVRITSPGPATYTVAMKDATEDAADWTVTPNPAEAGQTVTVKYNGLMKVESVKAVKKALTDEVTVTATANTTNEWTLTMPDSGVELEVKYRDLPYAALTVAPAAADGLGYNGEAQALITAGTVTGGTLYYALGTDKAAPTEANDWSTDLPTATDTGTYYVWYKVVGDDTHHGMMAASPLTVTIAPTFPALLTVTGNAGTACSAWLLDSSFKPLGESKMKAGDKFVLCVDMADNYDFNVSLSAGQLETTAFSQEDYERYLAYARANNMSIPMNTMMAWVTMPSMETGNLTVTVGFKQLKTFTVLYQPSATASEVWCRFGLNNNVMGMRYDAAKMKSDSEMGDAKVWSVKVSAAFDPSQVAFFATEEAARANGATMSNAVISQSASQWTTIGSDRYMIIGGNAKTVVAAFVADGSTLPLYDSETITFDGDVNSTDVRYQIAVCQTDADGNVTTAGTVTAMSAPATAPEGKTFDKWSTLVGTAPSKIEMRYTAGQTGISISENTIFRAVWKPAMLTATLNLNGGTGIGTTSNVTYNDVLTLGTPSRTGFAFDGWTVNQSVSESNELFIKGSPFDLGTPITANLGLTAQWKHVHSYTCYQISAFGDWLAKYQKYNDALHLAVCGCNKLGLMAHTFGSNGKCACGYEKPGAAKVTLEISYGHWSDGNYTEMMQGFPEETLEDHEVSISAPHDWGNLVFSKWQYSTGGKWYDLTAYEMASFIIPCTMQVRALYVNPVTAPQVELSARHYDDHAEVNGKTYTMDNVLYQMNYQLPDGYSFVDAGIRLGDNAGISYYELKERTISMDAEATAIATSFAVVTSILSQSINTFDTSASEKYYAERENSVLDEMSAATLAEYMMQSKPVNVEKYDPIYWEAKAQTKAMSGSMATMPPLRFIQKNNGNHYIYGIGYLKYKNAQGKIETICTDALATTRDNIPASPVTKVAGTAQAAPACMMARSQVRRAPAESPAEDNFNMCYVFVPETQLTVYVDGQWSATLSNSYGFGDKAVLEAPAVSGKTFSYWEADGKPVSSNQTLTLTMNANTTLRAVYGKDASGNAAAGFTSVTRSGEKISLQAIANAQATATGIIYSTSLTGDALTIDGDGVTQVEAQTLTDASTQMPASILDNNHCWMLRITPDDENTVYHFRAYATIGGTTTYSDVRDVKLSDLENGIQNIANLGGFEEELDEALTEVKESGKAVPSYALTIAYGSEDFGKLELTVAGVAATQAKKDDVVTVSVTPAKGYSVKDVNVHTASSAMQDDITVTNNETDGIWTFTMPETNVWVVVTYTKTTGITQIATSTADENVCYDLSGRRVALPTKGIYVKNGKIVVIK